MDILLIDNPIAKLYCGGECVWWNLHLNFYMDIDSIHMDVDIELTVNYIGEIYRRWMGREKVGHGAPIDILICIMNMICLQ